MHAYLLIGKSSGEQIQQIETKSPLQQSFLSRSKRFKELEEETPGPTSYSPISPHQNFHVSRAPINDQMKSYQWIIADDRFQSSPSQSNRIIGPGSYNPEKPNMNTLTDHSSWAKSTRFTSETKKPNQNLGPGSYNPNCIVQKIRSPVVSSVFKSKVGKPLFLANSESPLQKKQNQELILIEDIQNEEESQKQAPVKQNKKPLSVFESKIPRFPNQQISNLGPGSYEMSAKINFRDQFPRIITVHVGERKIAKNASHDTSPGPGDYDPQTSLVRKHTVQNTISKADRFSDKIYPSVLFPSSSLDPDNTHQENMRTSKNSWRKLIDLLSSRAPRDNPFLCYNLEIGSLGYKMKKSKEHLLKLKTMEVQIPAFNCKSKRLAGGNF